MATPTITALRARLAELQTELDEMATVPDGNMGKTNLNLTRARGDVLREMDRVRTKIRVLSGVHNRIRRGS